MVLDGTFYASTVASLMMNGVCCVWQMQEEEDRRDAIRRDIRVEYERQRLQERELWEQQKMLHPSFFSESHANTEGPTPPGSEASFPGTAAGGGDERRRKLVSEKLRLMQNSPLRQQQNQGDGRDDRYGLVCSSMPVSPSQVPGQRQAMRTPIPPKLPVAASSPSIAKAVRGPVSARKIKNKAGMYSNTSPQFVSINGTMASLMDDNDDDNDEQVAEYGAADEVESLVDVSLR